MQDWKIVNSSKYSLSCCTYVFHRCRLVLTFSVLAFSTLAYSYLRIPYLHIPSSGTFVFRTCVFSRPRLQHTIHRRCGTKRLLDRSQTGFESPRNRGRPGLCSLSSRQIPRVSCRLRATISRHEGPTAHIYANDDVNAPFSAQTRD